MKKLFTLFASVSCLILFTAMAVNGQQWATLGANIYNTNAGNVGIGTNAPATLLDVAKNMTEPIIRVYNLGGNGGATFEMKDLNSAGDWKFKVTALGGFKVRDQASALDVFTIEKNALANALYIKQGGNVGIGTTNPLEKLHVNGAVLVGNTANTNAGTIRWDGTNFQGYNGSGWVNLDFNWADPWIVLPNIPLGTPEFHSAPQPMSLSFAFPGIPNSMARLYVTDMSAPGIFPHQVEIESITLGQPAVLNASQLFRISAGMQAPFVDFSMGILGADGTFKVCLGAALTATAQSDNTTMIRANPTGVIDFANQSRVRAYQQDPAGAIQTIFPNIWMPVNFTTDGPLPTGYDEQGEFTPAATANVGVPPEAAYFTAQVAGYYQVNARVQFNNEYSVVGGPVMVTPMSYISIAIYRGPAVGASVPYAVGNNLQIGYIAPAGPTSLINNNAPNVSDVVFLNAGQVISIWVLQTAVTPMDLMQGPSVTYVTIHKVS
jgi:hypothetical protein